MHDAIGHSTGLSKSALIDQWPGSARPHGACPHFAAGRSAPGTGRVGIQSEVTLGLDPAPYAVVSLTALHHSRSGLKPPLFTPRFRRETSPPDTQIPSNRAGSS